MQYHRRKKRLAASLTAAGSAGVIAVGMMATAGIGSATTATLSLNYECPFPLIGVQDVAVDITTSELPDSIAVGERTPEFDIDAVSTVSEEATNGLNLVGAETIEGEALADSKIDAPEAELPVQVPMDIPQQPVPDEGELIVDAHGSAPSITFTEAGTAQIEVHDLLLTLTPRDGEGNETGLGTFESDCTQLPDQDNVLHEFTITDNGDGDDGGAEAGGDADGGGDNGGAEGGAEAGGDNGGAEGGAEAGGDNGGAEAGGADGGDNGGRPGDPVQISYDLHGESYINAADGTVPLTGGIDARMDLASGTYDADLHLDDTSGTFNIMGFMQADADVAFEQTRETTGTLDNDGNLTSSSEMYVYLTEVSSFGFPVGGGPDCRTVEPALVDLAGSGFDPFGGGTLAGEYDLPPFENCGQFNDMISMFASGPGNTIELTLSEEGAGDPGDRDDEAGEANGFGGGDFGDFGGGDFGDFGGGDFGDFGGGDFGDFGGGDFGDFGGW
ncbi:DUF6801 domain-containing protein [Haloechinothrix sp. LS1_15]|uniref:DUF6801 domain-containing protein n=1 Tax=Haloechinothrix sp. LS1_15 TaxID=2652248 RepID=UPI00294B38AA|nr:DUF6801 domain-containing protein [Haloechinothrix sp. LS1_15]